MSARKDGGPAFPFHHFDLADGEHGMTLRDYFAAKALAAEIARWPEGHPNGWEGIAAGAFAVADAMLAAREEGGAA
jgi:hypothetical protein